MVPIGRQIGALGPARTKSDLATEPLPSWRPKNGQIGYITAAFLGVPQGWGFETAQKVALRVNAPLKTHPPRPPPHWNLILINEACECGGDEQKSVKRGGNG